MSPEIQQAAAACGRLHLRTCYMLIALNKPFNVLCQFTDRSKPARRTLAEFIDVPQVYPAGRLDYDSEGLLLLTDDGALANRLTDRWGLAASGVMRCAVPCHPFRVRTRPVTSRDAGKYRRRRAPRCTILQGPD